MNNKPSALFLITFVFLLCACSESYGQSEMEQKIISLVNEKFAAAKNYSDQTPALLVGVWGGHSIPESDLCSWISQHRDK